MKHTALIKEWGTVAPFQSAQMLLIWVMLLGWLLEPGPLQLLRVFTRPSSVARKYWCPSTQNCLYIKEDQNFRPLISVHIVKYLTKESVGLLLVSKRSIHHQHVIRTQQSVNELQISFSALCSRFVHPEKLRT